MLKHYKANTEPEFTTMAIYRILSGQGMNCMKKLRHLEIFCEKLKIPINQCVCIGDGQMILNYLKNSKGITFTDA